MVEDDPATVSALRMLFSRRGWEVLVAGSLAEAGPLLDTHPGWMILDLMLPDGDGTVLLEKVRATGSGTRVAVTTGTADANRLRAVSDLRPEAVLRKPVDLNELLRTVA